MTVLDTNIIIEILNGNRDIVDKVKAIDTELAISSITTMELYCGAANKAELNKLERFLLAFHILHLSTDISKLSTQLIKQYAKSHTLDIPDSLIAATALSKNYKLFTLNLKDFKYIPKLRLL